MEVTPSANSCMRVLPSTTPCASTSRVTNVELLHGIIPASWKLFCEKALGCMGRLRASQLRTEPKGDQGLPLYFQYDIGVLKQSLAPSNAGVPAAVGYLQTIRLTESMLYFKVA